MLHYLKKIVVIAGVLLIGALAFFLLASHEKKFDQPTLVASKKLAPTNSVQPIHKPEVFQSTATQLDVENKSRDEFKLLFAQSLKLSGDTVHKSVVVYPLPKGDQPPYIFVAVSSEKNVVAKSIYRVYGNSEYSVGTVTDVRQRNWATYPPVDVAAATAIVHGAFPSAKLLDGNLYTLDQSTPAYQFLNGARVVLVSAETGDCIEVERDTLSVLAQKKRDPMLDIVSKVGGLLVVDMRRTTSMTDEERTKLLLSVETTNAAIRRGEITLDDKLEVVTVR